MGFMGDVPRSEMFDDVYFSADDGPGETYHVFLDGNNLPAAWEGETRFTIAETGFGTGLNFLLAWELFDRTAAKGAFLDFISVEKFPMSVEAIRQGLSPWAQRLSPYLEKMLGRYPMIVPGFHRIVFDNRVALTLIFGDANDVLPEVDAVVDAWFLDGFTPSKNPDMWTDKVFAEMARLSHDKTSFATFTSAGFVKRGLQAAGFHVEKRDGFGRKRDMLAGHYTGARKKPHERQAGVVSILGAGLAGCASACVLQQYGFSSVVHDPNGVATGASGNPAGMINPRFTAFRDAQSDFYTAGFALAARTFPSLDCAYTRCGALHLVTDEDKQKRFIRTAENWGWADDHMRYVDAKAASDIAGIDLSQDALYLPDAARINPALLCASYAKDISFGDPVKDAPAIYASGPALAGFEGLPLHAVRGQITFAKPTPQSARLKTALHYGGYASPAIDGEHVIGSTFQKWLSDTACLPEDDLSNLEKLHAATGLSGFEISGHRAALRVASKDRFPVIGQLDAGRYISTAHGSHGILSTLMGAHILADLLRGGPLSVGKSTLNALSLLRFKA
ncbi:MAG: tRNA U-34 5-methylaminomethyl-2-thiouridine biosynthesis protein [Micavibrio aeruginosavorus]|uniref:tRNA U-34 5-methylaminomethyl-2-thiouridine biosynthesis protein n=1 Tax=Micavibrio aeruginosavorus TaxID=349221 RepID=A0A2W5N3S2_9BACT|nr:MAG: tRNA U-34 5-methylaminomethyl-2-thiouridine biosynthesis protein [Micavibrio aeruginosavorus]